MNIDYIKNYVLKKELDKANFLLSTWWWKSKEKQRLRTELER